MQSLKRCAAYQANTGIAHCQTLQNADATLSKGKGKGGRRKAESDAALAALIGKYEKDAPCNIAYVYAYRGEADQAFALGRQFA